MQHFDSLHAQEDGAGCVTFNLTRLSRARTTHALVQTQDTKGPRGVITIASQNIKQGNIIMIERPLLRITYGPGQTQQNFDASHVLAETQIKHPTVYTELMMLHGEGGTTAQHTFQTNAFMLDSNPPLVQAVCSEISRINHSCLANAYTSYAWEENDYEMSLLALTDIQKGEEISISYITLDNWPQYHARQKHLKDVWHFECGCTICGEPVVDRNKRDNQWARIATLQNQLEAFVSDPRDREPSRRLMKEYEKAVEQQIGTQLAFDSRDMIPPHTDFRLPNALNLLIRARAKSNTMPRRTSIVPLAIREAHIIARLNGEPIPTLESTLSKILPKYFVLKSAERPTRPTGRRTRQR